MRLACFFIFYCTRQDCNSKSISLSYYNTNGFFSYLLKKLSNVKRRFLYLTKVINYDYFLKNFWVNRDNVLFWFIFLNP